MAEEERHIDRQPQLLPQRVVELEVVDPQPPVADEPVTAGSRLAAVEQDRARAAGAQQLAAVEVEQVAVLGGDRRSAQLAALELRLLLARGLPRQCLQPRQAFTSGSGQTRLSICSSPGAGAGVDASSASTRSTSGAAR
jgi:hypothetical protein